MTESEILEKYKNNCMQIGDAVYKNTLNDGRIKQLIQENLKLEETMQILKGSSKVENNSPTPISEN